MAPKSEKYVLPSDYVGVVVVLYGHSAGGQPTRDKSGTAVYHVPENGIMCLQHDVPEAGFYRKEFFYEAETGIRRPLPHRVSEDVVQVFADAYGYTDILDGPPTGGVHWLAYVVGTPGDRTDWIQARDRAVEAAIRLGGHACRSQGG